MDRDRRKEDERVAILENELAHLKGEISKLENITADYQKFRTAFEASSKTTKFFASVIFFIVSLFAAKIAFFSKILGG